MEDTYGRKAKHQDKTYLGSSRGALMALMDAEAADVETNRSLEKAVLSYKLDSGENSLTPTWTEVGYLLYVKFRSVLGGSSTVTY